MTPYVGEIRMFAGNFPPAGWEFCNGQLISISENDALFQLIGTTYGGDGQSTFALPDLRGRTPVHQGTSSASGTTYQIGETGGVEEVTLTTAQIPSHTHPLLASTAPGTADLPAGGVPATAPAARRFTAEQGVAPDTDLDSRSVAPMGGNQPHTNMQPFLGVSHIISMWGIFPSAT